MASYPLKELVSPEKLQEVLVAHQLISDAWNILKQNNHYLTTQGFTTPFNDGFLEKETKLHIDKITKKAVGLKSSGERDYAHDSKMGTADALDNLLKFIDEPTSGVAAKYLPIKEGIRKIYDSGLFQELDAALTTKITEKDANLEEANQKEAQKTQMQEAGTIDEITAKLANFAASIKGSAPGSNRSPEPAQAV